MEFFKISKTIPFMRHALVFNIISAVTFVLAVVFLITKGLHFSIEFTGGTVMEVRFAKPIDTEQVRAAIRQTGVVDFTVQNFGTAQDVLIRLPLKSEGAAQNEAMQKQADSVMAALAPLGVEPTVDPKDGKEKPQAKRIEFVGGQVGQELAWDGIKALLFVCVGIVIYLAIRFEWRFAVATIIANLHDVVIILGFFALFQWEFSLPVLAGVLAVLGYSVNESVVVFDRAREMFKKLRRASTDEVFDAAITGTISRTIITHGTTQMAVITMLLFGGATLHYFALALTIGICFGIYSSVLVACPIAKYLGASRADFVKPEKKSEGELVIP
jgi:preprotein translocase subunit SecF